MSKFVDLVLNYPGRMAMPIGVYAGLEMTGASVRQAVSDPTAQSDAVLALRGTLAEGVEEPKGPSLAVRSW